MVSVAGWYVVVWCQLLVGSNGLGSGIVFLEHTQFVSCNMSPTVVGVVSSCSNGLGSGIVW